MRTPHEADIWRESYAEGYAEGVKLAILDLLMELVDDNLLSLEQVIEYGPRIMSVSDKGFKDLMTERNSIYDRKYNEKSSGSEIA